MRRIYHHWETWECFKAGFYETSPPDGMDADQATGAYRDFLADIARFNSAMARVLAEWPHSCEQFLSNPNINRIAWLGQSAMCIDTGVPSVFRGGFKLLTPQQQRAANRAAEIVLEQWLITNATDAHESSGVHQAMEGLRLS